LQIYKSKKSQGRFFSYILAIWHSSLAGLGICEEVNHGIVGKSLLYVMIDEADNGVAIREALSFDSVVEIDFFLSIRVCLLYLHN
jgi:hypothetical protein